MILEAFYDELQKVAEYRLRDDLKRELKGSKRPGHVETRLQERAPRSGADVAKLRKALRRMTLKRGETYHYELPHGRGAAIIGPAGRRHVVKTIYGPGMKPPGTWLSQAHVRAALGRRKAPTKGRFSGEKTLPVKR